MTLSARTHQAKGYGELESSLRRGGSISAPTAGWGFVWFSGFPWLGVNAVLVYVDTVQLDFWFSTCGLALRGSA